MSAHTLTQQTPSSRKEQVTNALANSALEGLHPTPEMRADLEEYIQGRITIEEGIKRLEARICNMLSTDKIPTATQGLQS